MNIKWEIMIKMILSFVTTLTTPILPTNMYDRSTSYSNKTANNMYDRSTSYSNKTANKKEQNYMM